MADLDMYDVTVRGLTTQMKLSADDAAGFGDAAKKVGKVKPAEAQPAPTQPWAAEVDESGAVVESGDEPVAEKKAPPARNKARTTK